MSYSNRAYRRLKRRFQSQVFNGLGLWAFVRYWFTIRKARKTRGV